MKKEVIFNDIMIDIETMGNGSNSAIVSIGAVKFDMTSGETGDTFYQKVDLQSCIDIGLTVKASTIMWWLDQNEEARKELTKGEHVSITYALNLFSDYCNTKNLIWGNSPRFDLGIMHDAYRAIKKEIPWNFRNERDVRTLVGFEPDIKQNYVYKGYAHNALDDCYNQIEYCNLTYKKIRNL